MTGSYLDSKAMDGNNSIFFKLDLPEENNQKEYPKQFSHEQIISPETVEGVSISESSESNKKEEAKNHENYNQINERALKMVEEYLVSVETNSQTNDYKEEDKHEDVDNNRKCTCTCKTFIDDLPEQPTMLYFEPDYDIYEVDEMDLESGTENCDIDEIQLVQETAYLKIHHVKTTEHMEESESPDKIKISFKSVENFHEDIVSMVKEYQWGMETGSIVADNSLHWADTGVEGDTKGVRNQAPTARTYQWGMEVSGGETNDDCNEIHHLFSDNIMAKRSPESSVSSDESMNTVILKGNIGVKLYLTGLKSSSK
jgi:hypothetical protein